ncbi:CdaR family transcriptional regulator, partial [uncultured Trichococcus sp.]|uniref:PucR family transcriptional regulator n=1 Tax=uncultured Trichococcus sp. TaxID=189665 RepID=UPI002598453F
EKADEVPYVDVTHDLHRALINKHYEMIDRLERFSSEVNQLLLSADALPKILQLLYRYLRLPVIYRTMQGETICLPAPATEEKKERMEALLQQSRDGVPGVSVAVKSVQAFNQKWAELAIVSPEHEITEFETLILDRCVTALAQELMRRLYVEEKRRQQEDQWLFDWLNGKHEREKVVQQLKSIEPALKSLDFNAFMGTVCIARIKRESAFFSSSYESKLLHASFVARSIFQQHGWMAITVVRDGFLIFVLIDKRQGNGWKTRVQKALERVREVSGTEEIDFPLTDFGVGRLVHEVTDVPRSYREAQKVLEMEERLGKPLGPLFEDLYIFRLMDALPPDELRRFVRDYLQPVIDYDRLKGGELMQTLAMYLACRGSKQETAEKLYIVRQTLYHRLQKLEELLGNDFMSPEKRLALEFAVHAYQYLGK